MIVRHLKTSASNGSLWFSISSAIPAVVSILLGPLILKKVGLEEYGVLSLAAYYLLLVATYSDFGGYSHLLIAFSKKTPERYADVAHVFMLRAILLALFFLTLEVFVFWKPRSDLVYSFLGISMVGLMLPSTNFEWYFMARKRYFHIFLVRVWLNGCLIALMLFWFFSESKNPTFVPIINVAAASTASLALLWLLGIDRVYNGICCLTKVSFAGIGRFFLKLFPLAASQLLTPYFLAYALVWFSETTSDRKLIGAFSIGYRMTMGFSALVGPFVLYAMPRFAVPGSAISFRKMLGLSVLVVCVFWCLGLPVLWIYFHVSKVDPGMFSYTLRIFSILMLAIFFLCLRTPYVARWLISGRYMAYFIMLLISCAPVLMLSWIVGGKVSPGSVAWLACLPDFLATIIFLGYNRMKALRVVVLSR